MALKGQIPVIIFWLFSTVLPSKAQKFHHNFPDPAKVQGTEEEIMQQFREVREMIKTYFGDFAKEYLQ